jgi:hypothetical protein
MRLIDFVCDHCGARWEVPEASGQRVHSRHCGRPSRRLIGAPNLIGVQTRYRHALGREGTNRDVDAHLARRDAYIPSEREAREVRQMTEDRVLPEYFEAPPDDTKINKAIEKAVTRLETEKSQGLHGGS